MILNTCVLPAVLTLLSAPARADEPPNGERYAWRPSDRAYYYSVRASAPAAGTISGRAMVRQDGEETIAGRVYVKEVTTLALLSDLDRDVTFYRKGADGIYAIEEKHRDAGEYLVM